MVDSETFVGIDVLPGVLIPASGGFTFYNSPSCNYLDSTTEIGALDDNASMADLSQYDPDEVERYNELVKKKTYKRYGRHDQLTRESANGDVRLPDYRTLSQARYEEDPNKTEYIKNWARQRAPTVYFPEEAMKRQEVGVYAGFFESMCEKPPDKKDKGAVTRDFVGRVNYDAVCISKHIEHFLKEGSVFVNPKKDVFVSFTRQCCGIVCCFSLTTLRFFPSLKKYPRRKIDRYEKF